MDIVHRIAVDELGGDLELATTRDVGTTFTLHVPLTIAIIDVFSFECGAQTFAVPVSAIEEIFELGPTRPCSHRTRAGREPRRACSSAAVTRSRSCRSAQCSRSRAVATGARRS